MPKLARHVLGNWEKTGLLVFEDKNGDGRIQYYGPGLDDKAAGYGWAGTTLAPDDAAHWVLGISPGSLGAVGALINFIVAYAVSKMTPPPSPAEIQEMVEHIRIPAGAGGPGGDH